MPGNAWRSERSKKYLRSKNVGDAQPIYSRQTTAFRVSYPSELRQKLKETLKNPSGFIRCLSYQDVKSHPGPSTVKDAIATSRPDCSATDLPSLDGQITPRASLSPSSPFRKNNSACDVGQISGSSSRVPPEKRGVGHRHERWAGCGGRFWCARRAT